MSGPKCVEYDVARLAAVRAAALAQLRADAQALRARELALAARREAAASEGLALGDSVELQLEVGDDPGLAEGRIRTSRQLLERAESDLVTRLAAHRAQAAVASLAALGVGASAIVAAPRPAAPGERVVEKDDRSERVARKLAYLPPVIPEQLRERVLDAAEVAATGGPQHLDQLGHLVDQCLEAAAAASRARELLDQALGLTSPQVVPVLAALLEVEKGRATATDQDWAQWTAVLDTARRESDREYVLATTAAALADLGYAVGEEFVTDPDLASTIATRDGWSQHGVQLRAPQASRQLNVNVVREGSDASRDTQVETSFCDDLASVRAAWEAAGIASTVKIASNPGEVAVQQVPALPSVQRRASAQRRSAKALKAKERPL